MLTVTPLAAGHLWLLLSGESEQNRDKLGFRIGIMTTGCHGFSYSVSLSERELQDMMIKLHGLCFFYRAVDQPYLDGLTIDLNRDTGKLTLSHPNPPNLSCSLPQT